MSVFINGEFSSNTDGILGIWSDFKRVEYDPRPNQRYIQTIMKVPDFETAEELISMAIASRNYREGQSTANDLKHIIQSLQYKR